MEDKYKFKSWVESHNPKLKWDWNNPKKISKQLNRVIKECGNLELKTLFMMFFSDHGDYDNLLTKTQVQKFLTEKY